MSITTPPARPPATVLSGFIGAGEDSWQPMPDPFPAWDLDDLARADDHQH